MYGFVALDPNSSVYREVTAQLTSEVTTRGRDWRLLDKQSSRFHLMLGPRNRLPFSNLGTVNGYKQLVNYYRGSSAICRKAALTRTLKECNHLSQSDTTSPPLPDWLPPSFVIYPESAIPTNEEDKTSIQSLKAKFRSSQDEREAFRAAHTHIADQGGGRVWIAKSTIGAKGENIMISGDPEQLIQFVSDKCEAFIVQKYIEQPLLLPGNRKFDIRLWVLVDHCYDIHVFKEGVLRTASDPYDSDDLEKVTSHLTNHCLQEALSENYGKYEEGNEMFFGEFDRFLQNQHQTTLQESLLPQMYVIVKHCLLAIKEKVSTESLTYDSFQLFGFDFMVDEAFKVWLLEVNGASACASKLLEEMALGLIQTAIDAVFSPSQPTAAGKSFFKIT